MINKEEVGKIAKLARLKLADEENEKMQKDLSEVLDYFNLLKKAKPRSEIADSTIGVKSKTAILDSEKKKRTVRQDQPKPQPDLVAEKLVKAAPDKKEKYIKVKAIL